MKRFILPLCLVLGSGANASQDCYPKPDVQLPQYLVAYGSLMQERSKKNTDHQSGDGRPVWIAHYQRGWFLRSQSPGPGTSYLAVYPTPKARFNGTIFRLLNTAVLEKYDEREKYYCRVQVPPSTIHPLDHHKLPQGQFWIYEIQSGDVTYPSEQYPIVQSYVDIFLGGCLDLQTKFHLDQFAADCIATTDHWSSHWVNDRVYPRRPFEFVPQATEIDRLLHSKLTSIIQQTPAESP